MVILRDTDQVLTNNLSKTALLRRSLSIYTPTMLKKDFTITKRQLGAVMLILGVLGVVGIFAIDLLNAGQEGGIGPAQQLGIAIMGLIALIGASLIPLGDMPA